jgi:hypothetical protein
MMKEPGMTTYMGSIEVSRAACVAERVYALDEPWRSRFLQLIASFAHVVQTDGPPSRADVVNWLDDEELNEKIRLMLHTWTRRSN